MRNVLVTGGTGKTGRQVAEQLSTRADVGLHVASRHPDRGDQRSVFFDWEDARSWPDALRSINAVYLVKPHTADPTDTVSAFLHAAHDQGVERIVLLSEIAAEKQDADADELRVEKVVEAGPLGWTILRPNWFMQNFATPSFFGDDIRARRAITVPSAGQAVSFVDTRDIAAVAVTALLEPGHEGRRYTLTGAQAVTFSQAMDRIGKAAGYEVRHLDPPVDAYLAKRKEGGASNDAVAYYGRVYRNIQKGFTSLITRDIETVTGSPPRSFADFVEENRRFWMN